MFESLMSKAIEYTPADRLGVIEKAYSYAEDAHRDRSASPASLLSCTR